MGNFASPPAPKRSHVDVQGTRENATQPPPTGHGVTCVRDAIKALSSPPPRRPSSTCSLQKPHRPPSLADARDASIVAPAPSAAAVPPSGPDANPVPPSPSRCPVKDAVRALSSSSSPVSCSVSPSTSSQQQQQQQHLQRHRQQVGALCVNVYKYILCVCACACACVCACVHVFRHVCVCTLHVSVCIDVCAHVRPSTAAKSSHTADDVLIRACVSR